MKEEKRGLWIRLVLGFVLGAAAAAAIVYFWWGSFLIGVGAGRPVSAFGSSFLVVLPPMAAMFGSAELAVVIQGLLGGLLGALVALATLPFADEGPELIKRSLIHFALTSLSFVALLQVCRWTAGFTTLLYLFLLAVLYVLIWLGRWVGWYMEVIQLRQLLGLDPGPTPLKWRETLPYLPFVLLVCDLLPVVLRGVELALGGGDVLVFTWLLYPWLLMPVIGYVSGLSLGKRQGVCPLYPLACFVCYFPLVYLLFNGTALHHCFLVAVPALAGNVTGWLYRRAVPKNRGPGLRD